MRGGLDEASYPRKTGPARGTWGHGPAAAARAAGGDGRVLGLYRPLPPARLMWRPGAWISDGRQPRRAVIDGIAVRYVRYLAPPRGRSYVRWGDFAARPLKRALRRLRREFPYELIHAHYAVPAADAVLQAGIDVPLVISEHGADVFSVAQMPGGLERIEKAFGSARLVLANSDGIERAVRRLGAHTTRVVPLGTDPAGSEPPKPEHPTLVTVAHLVPRKRHADVLRAIWILRDRKPDLRYRIVGDGPSRAGLEAITAELGLTDRVEFTGQLSHDAAVRASREGSIFVMPSIDEAFGVAYIEAMAAGRPAIGSRGEPGPEHLAARTIGMRLVSPGEPESLATEIVELLEPRWGARVRRSARQTVAEQFTWEACGQATVAAYEEALATP